MDICLSIGVARATQTAPLPGAHVAARDIGQWATLNGYKTAVVTDEDSLSVTVDRLKTALLPLLSDRAHALGRVVISFAGHGLIRDVGSEYWLLSDWTDGDQAVDVGLFKRRLRSFGPKQISVFSDACRTLIASSQLELRGSPLLPVAGFRSPSLQTDTIQASQAGEAAYAIDGSCFMSSVLVRALWGKFDDAVEDRPGMGPVVSSDRLMASVESRLANLAGLFDIEQEPECLGQFRHPMDDVYTRLQGKAAPDFPQLPAPVPNPEAGPTDAFLVNRLNTRGPKRGPESRQVQSRQARLAKSLTELCAPGAPRVLVSGAGSAAVMVPRNAVAVPDGQGWTLKGASPGAPILIKTDTDLWVGAAHYPTLAVSFVVDTAGCQGLLFADAREPIRRSPELRTTRALARLTDCGLSIPEASELALGLRQGKHRDPVLGVLAAYVYSQIDDIRSIRSMASWYVESGQPIPFDIVLLADVPVARRGGLLIADIPGVERTEPHSRRERENLGLLQARQACSGVVGGAFPWMRAGWRFLTDFPDSKAADLADLADELTPAPFTTLSNAAGRSLARLIED